jgi:hypothetical protein
MTGKHLTFFIPKNRLKLADDLMTAELEPADDLPMLRAALL